MSLYKFVSNERPTLGVEIELNLVDRETMALRSGVLAILEDLPPELELSVKPELFQCYLEINSKICQNVGEAESDLGEKLRVVRQLAARRGLHLHWGGTHPFSPLARPASNAQRTLSQSDQPAARNGPPAGDLWITRPRRRRLGDKAIMICDRILQHLPTLLAPLGQQSLLARPADRIAFPAQQDHGDPAHRRVTAAYAQLVRVYLAP